jgi:predicted signal transduction protein with EAL and GGDEF domain
MPSWKHRRRLIYASYILGAGMVIFGAITYPSDTQVGSQMVIGGVGLITVILTAYTGFAAYEDTQIHKHKGENPDG